MLPFKKNESHQLCQREDSVISIGANCGADGEQVETFSIYVLNLVLVQLKKEVTRCSRSDLPEVSTMMSSPAVAIRSFSHSDLFPTQRP